MLTVQVINHSILTNYSGYNRSNGYKYYASNRVKDVDIDEEKMAVWATVIGNQGNKHEVEFRFNNDIYIWQGSCECGKEEYCKHQAAVLYELNDRFSDKTKKEKKAPVAKIRQLTTLLESKQKGLEGKSSGEYRLLPMTENRLNQALERHTPRHFHNLAWNESFIGKFITENEIELRSIPSYNNYNFKEKKIVIKKEDKGFYVKCLTCNKEMNTLCDHQMSLLTKTKQVIQNCGFLNDPKGLYKDIVAFGVEKTGVDQDVFHKYFAITLDPNGFGTEAINDNMVGPAWIDLTKDLLEEQEEERKEIAEYRTQQLEAGRKKKFAFHWGANRGKDIDEDLVLYFVQGDALKTKEGIHGSKRVVEEVPSGFPKGIQEIGRTLFFYAKEEKRAIRFEKVKECIQNNITLLNSIYHYTYQGDMNYEGAKASDMNLVHFEEESLECKFTVVKKDGLIQLERHISCDGDPFDYAEVVYTNGIFCSTTKKAYCYSNEYFSDFMALFSRHDVLILPYSTKEEYTQFVSGLKKHFEVEIEDGLIMEDEILKDPQYQILLREVGNFILFEPRLKYGDYSFNAFDGDSYHIKDKVFRADETDRQFLIDFVKQAHPEFNNAIQVQDYVYLDLKSMINNYWFIHFNEACEIADIEVLGEKELTKFKYSKHRAMTFTHVKSGIDWFDVEMGLSFGAEKIKTADWIKALRNKESFVKLKDGTLGVLPEEWLKEAQKILAVADVEKGELKISKYRYNIIEDLFEDIDDKTMIKELAAKKKRLAEIDLAKKYKLPKIVKATLRPYQKHGFEWLKFLDESNFGGILADDMGLGKTLQVISLLADQIKEAPSLVIVPRSLLFNWGAELDKFCAKLKYVIHHGTGRAKMMEEISDKNVIITTYGTATSDIKLLKDFTFNYIILDESQAIKNPASKRYKAMRLLKAKNRIAMTGTPIENNTFDLYAQLSFTSPGLLGTPTSFKNSFAIPIDNNGDIEAANLLRKLIHPFLLRRTKEQVAKDLPAKTESIIYCEMGPTQRKLYNSLKRKIKEDIEEAVEEKGVSKSKFQMLDGLLRLRQMCNSPLLVNSTFTGNNADSVKIDILLKQITEELGGHNALVFSQFVSLLTIVRNELDKRGIKYAYLDGSTSKRQEEVEKFMNKKEIKIFLISLKAGNTGLNLTKADYVYILDPWWNPAVEAQAIDRTHRIGQDKQIFAYKLICKDSIEEKILKLQEKKKNLAKDLIRTDENVLKSLKKEELMALFD